jgi:hypothetical protein
MCGSVEGLRQKIRNVEVYTWSSSGIDSPVLAWYLLCFHREDSNTMGQLDTY